MKGQGDQYDYGMRMYDPRVGRFLSLDPLTKKYAGLTPYQYTSNSPIAGIDMDGKEFDFYLGAAEFLEKHLFGTSHIQKMKEGFLEQGAKDLKEAYNGIQQLMRSKNFTFQYGNDFTTLTAGIPPGYKPELMPSEQKLEMQMFKGMAKEYGDLMSRAFKGDDKAVGALGFEATMFILPGGEEGKGITLIPRGFKDAEQLTKVGEELVEALNKSGIKFKEIGIAGSSVTGVSSKGGEFREIANNGMKASDIDAYIILDEDIPVSGGAKRPDFIHPEKLMKKYPALREWSEKWSDILKREITPAAIKPKKPPTN